MIFNILNFIPFKIFGRSKDWSSVRKEHLINFPSCAACGKTTKLEVHHIKPYHIDPNLELDPDNLITLCADPCHLIFGHLKHWKSWNVDVKEDCEKYLFKLRHRPQ